MVATPSPEKPIPSEEKKAYKPKELIDAIKNELERKKQADSSREKEYNTAAEKLEKAVQETVKENEEVWLTGVELEKFINQENFPPEEVHDFLEKRKEIVGDAKKEKKGLMEGIKAKGEELKEKAVSLEEKGKKLIEDKKKALTENMTPVDKVKAAWHAFTFGIEFAWYSIWAKIGFDWAKKGLAALVEEKAKQGVEGAKKALDKMAGKPDDKEKPSTLEKLAPAAVLGGLATGLFAILPLPKSIKENLTGKNGGEVLKFFKKRRMLKLFGFGGITLLAASTLFAHFEEHPETLKELGEMPQDAEGKKSWWTKALDKAKIGAKEGGDKLLEILTGAVDIADGQALKNHFETREKQEGYVDLKDSKLVKNVKDNIDIFILKMEGLYKRDPQGCLGVLLAASQIPATREMLSVVIKGGLDLAKAFLKIIWGGAKSAKNHPFLWGVGLVLGVNSWEAIKHIQVKQDMQEDDIAEMFDDMTNLDELPEHFEEFGEGFMKGNQARSVGEALRDNGKYLALEIEETWNKLPEKLDDAVRKALEQEDNEKISGTNRIGLEAFQNEMQVLAMETKNQKAFEKLLGTDLKSGVLKEVITKSSKGNLITMEEITSLSDAAKGTNISIFIDGNQKDGEYVQWINTSGDASKAQLPKNICINPTLPKFQQLRAAQEFLYDPYITGGLERGRVVAGKFVENGQRIISDFRKCFHKDPERGASLLQELLGDKTGGLLGFGSSLYFVDYLGNKYLLGPIELCRLSIGILSGKNKELMINEALVHYAEGLVPVFLIGVGKAALFGSNIGTWQLIGETAIYPLTAPVRGAYSGFKYGKYVWEKFRTGKIGEIFTDRAFQMKDRILGIPGKLTDFTKYHHIQSRLRAAKILTEMGREHEAEKILKYLNDKGYFMSAKINGAGAHVGDIGRLMGEVEAKINAADSKIQKVFEKIKEIAGSAKDKAANVIAKLNSTGSWKKTLDKLEELNPGMGTIIFATMAYSMITAEDKKEAVAQQVTGTALFLAGRFAGKQTLGRAFTNPLIKEAIGVLSGLGAAVLGDAYFDIHHMVADKVESFMGTGEFSRAVWNQAGKALGMFEFFMANKKLLEKTLGKSFYKMIDKMIMKGFGAGIEKFGLMIVEKVGLKFIGKMLTAVGEKLALMLGERGALFVGGLFEPGPGWVADVGLLAWTAWDGIGIYQMWSKASNMKNASDMQAKKPIKSVTMDTKGEQSIRDIVTTEEPLVNYDQLGEEQKAEYRMKYYEKVARCNITIIREDDSEENYGYAAGEPNYAKIKDSNGKIYELTKEDLSAVETWKAPTDYHPETIPYDKIGDAGLAQYYKIQIQKLRVSTKWQQLDAQVESSKKLMISREGFPDDKLTLERQGDNSWKIKSESTNTVLPGSYDFHGGLAMAGLALYSMEFLKKEVYEKKDIHWKSEDGTKTPFSANKKTIVYAKDDRMDTNFIGEEWSKFYENNLKLNMGNMANTLNTYFGAIAEKLGLLGD